MNIKSFEEQIVQKYREAFISKKVLYIHTLNKQKETAVLDKQGRNI